MKLVSIFLSVFAISACSELQLSDEPKADVSHTAETLLKPLGQDSVLSRLGTLPAQHLSAGECGLFLWVKRDDAPFVFFQKSPGSDGLMMVDGQVQSLTRENAERPIALNFFEYQEFSVSGLELSLTIVSQQDQNLLQGLKVPQGSLSVKSADGWSAVLPVAGAIGCQ